MKNGNQSPELDQYISPLGAWALSFGCAVGWGAFVMPGTTFLPLAGPLGTVIGMAVGAALMLVIGANYHFLMNRYPDAGGTMTYATKIFGYDHGFLSSWFLILVYVAILWANATALVLIFRNLMGSALQFGFHYQISGYDVYLGEALISVAAIVLIGIICIKGKRLAIGLQILMALILIGGIVVCFVAVMAKQGGTAPLTPAYAPSSARPLAQIIQIVVLAPWAFVGFESVSHSVRGFRFPVRKTIWIIAAALLTGALAYILLSAISAAIQPEGYSAWTDYIADLDGLDGIQALPTFFAANAAMGRAGFVLLGITVLCGILTGLLGNLVAASRLLYAMAADNIIPKWCCGKQNKDHVPQNAILFLMLISLPIPFLGQTAIGWIVDVNTIGATIAYAYASASAFKAARRENNLPVQATGIAGVIISALFFLYFMLPNLWSVSAMSTESYLILIAWSILGFVVYRTVFHREKDQRFGKSTVVWIVLLALIFSSSMIWMRQSTRDYTQEVLENLNKYNAAELAEHGIQMTEIQQADSEYYLERQMADIGSFLNRNSAIQMALILLALLIMFNIYNTIIQQRREMEKQKLQAEESSKAKTAFLFNMSHDLRTPMNAITGYTALAGKEEMSPQAAEYVAKIDSSSRHLLTLIDDILEMSRIESGKLELKPKNTDLVESIGEVRDMFQGQMDEKHIDFAVETDQVVNRWVLCDKDHLTRILLNLVSNACKFTPDGGSVRVSLRQVDTQAERGFYELRVKDNGIGMSEEFAAKVFDAFERERTSTDSRIQGTGIGLAITKSLVDLMGGDIEVHTEKGKGTEFVVRLDFPLIDPPVKETAPDAVEPEPQAPDFNGRKLLLVEDNEINREIAVMLLEELGFALDTAENGQIAVDRMKDAGPDEYDAILMDIQMPVMNGYEAAKAIRELDDPAKAGIPIIAVTANALPEDVQAARDAGMNGHVGKPLDIENLIKTLADILQK